MRWLLAIALVGCVTHETEMPLRLQSARDIRYLPALDGTEVAVLPGDYASWSAAFSANPGKNFTVTNADYTAMGSLSVTSTAGGTVLAPRFIRYVGSDAHLLPSQRAGEARVGSIRVSGATSTDWLFSGLTTRGKTQEASLFSGPSNITIDRCLDEGTVVAYGFRVREATNVTFQHCVLRTPDGVGTVTQNEKIGIAVGNIDADVLGIKILNTQIIDFSDAVQSFDGPTARKPVELTIDGCDFHLTSASYLPDGTAYCENGIDLKAGSDRPNSTIIRNTRIWGLRKNAAGTDTGVGITLHRYCRNVVMEDVDIGDCPEGIREVGWPVGEDLTEPRNLKLTRVSFHDITNIDGDSTGAALTLINNTQVSFCTFSRCDYLLNLETDAQAGGPTFWMNTRTETEVLHPDSTEANPYVEGVTTGNVHRTRTVIYDTYERAQHTGPEFAEGAYEVSTCTYAQIRDEQARLVEAITPTSAAQVKFQREEGRIDFRQWAQANPSACFRRFAIMGSQRLEGPLVTNTDVETYRTDTIVVLAYPKQFAKYGAENIRDLQDLVEEDIFAIDDTIGHRGQNNFLGGQNYCTRTDEAPVDDGGSVWFVTLTFETEYQRAV